MSGIRSKIAAVQAAVEAVGYETAKITGTGSSYSYNYVSEKAMFGFLRTLLADQGIATVQRASVVSETGNACTVSVEVDFMDAESDELVTASMVAKATDKGDKAMAKAITSATRYLYWKTFRFPVDDPGADPESEAAAPTTIDSAEAAKLVGQLRELARTKGYGASVETALADHVKETGQPVHHPDFVRGLLRQLEAAPVAGQGATPDQAPVSSEAPAQAAEDPFAAVAETATAGTGPMTPDQRKQIIEIVTGEDGLQVLKPKVDWTAKVNEKCAEWYDGATDWEKLNTDQAADLAGRLETVRLTLAAGGVK